uniref:Uncharacterized protein n=1 Tax=Nomascus leucogenys TaxID=61853 RepID=A0A2I3FZM8_NOMLE
MQPVVQATPCHSIKTRMASSSSQPVAIFFPRGPFSMSSFSCHTGRRGCSWHPGTRGQAYYQTARSAQDSPRCRATSTVLRLRSPGLETLSGIDVALLRAPWALLGEPVLSWKAESLTLLTHNPPPPTQEYSPLPRSKDGRWDKL